MGYSKLSLIICSIFNCIFNHREWWRPIILCGCESSSHGLVSQPFDKDMSLVECWLMLCETVTCLDRLFRAVVTGTASGILVSQPTLEISETKFAVNFAVAFNSARKEF